MQSLNFEIEQEIVFKLKISTLDFSFIFTDILSVKN